MDQSPPVPKLVRGRLKLRLALAAALALVLGYLLAPPAARREAPEEKVVPMLAAQVERRDPARVFRGAQDVGGRALDYAVSFPGPRRPERVQTSADFTGEPQDTRHPAGLGVIVSKDGDVLTHVRAVSGELAPYAQLPGGPLLRGRVAAYEPESGLVLVRLDPGAGMSPPALARTAPEPGELAVAAARMDGRDFVAPVFIAAVADERYALSAASGVVVPGTPVYNLAGELVALAAGSPAVSLAFAVGPALERLSALRASARAIPRSLGLSLQALAGELAARLGEPGVLVSDVTEGGPAARAGLRPGDVLEAIGGTELRSVEQAQAQIAGGGKELALRLRRAGRGREQRVATLLVLEPPAAAPRAVAGPPARALFSAGALEASAVGTDARVIAIEGTVVGSEAEAARLLRRHRPPWLVYAQDDTRRFFAVVAEPSP